MTDWIEHFRAAACGLTIAHVWRGHGSVLFIELGALTPTTRRNGYPGEPRGEIGLMVEWSWRIEDGRSEPPRVFRRPFGLGQAAKAWTSAWA
ncbi:hypothetical protein ABIE45_006399 [Methylobacterium sp. OAE515]|uniref:hypothetical protein n=1 Tax=Methylobacterium sp. OAE515 TaxID=2817895 RepID=UPI001789A12C